MKVTKKHGYSAACNDPAAACSSTSPKASRGHLASFYRAKAGF